MMEGGRGRKGGEGKGGRGGGCGWVDLDFEVYRNEKIACLGSCSHLLT